MTHSIIKNLIELNISCDDSFEEIYGKVRDRDDIKVLKCKKSGVIVLSSINHISDEYYAEVGYWGGINEREYFIKRNLFDDSRRKKQFFEYINGKKWLDFGSGIGGVLEQLAAFASSTKAIEPQVAVFESLKHLGYDIFRDAESVPDNDFDTVTLFHVLEHLTDPIGVLKTLKSKIKPGGIIIVEVPHAGDVLLSLFESESFKEFTFWSEHLILHTKNSLRAFLTESGFNDINIYGFQRFPISNHFYWLSKNKPGGHEKWNFLTNETIDSEYMKLLDAIDKTDTLIAIAKT